MFSVLFHNGISFCLTQKGKRSAKNIYCQLYVNLPRIFQLLFDSEDKTADGTAKSLCWVSGSKYSQEKYFSHYSPMIFYFFKFEMLSSLNRHNLANCTP